MGGVGSLFNKLYSLVGGIRKKPEGNTGSGEERNRSRVREEYKGTDRRMEVGGVKVG